LTLYTAICKLVPQVAPPAVGLTSNLKLKLITLTFDLSTYKWGHGLPVSWASLCQFSACYALLFST